MNKFYPMKFHSCHSKTGHIRRWVFQTIVKCYYNLLELGEKGRLCSKNLVKQDLPF
jgi:hypothetical protein